MFELRFFFFQAEDGIRYLVRSRGLGDVYKRQVIGIAEIGLAGLAAPQRARPLLHVAQQILDAIPALSLIHI